MPVLSPRLDRIIVEPVEKPTTTPGGIVLPGNVREEGQKAGQGRVVAVGPGKLDWTPEQKAIALPPCGAIVHFSLYSANEIQFGGKKFYALSSDEILATEV